LQRRGEARGGCVGGFYHWTTKVLGEELVYWWLPLADVRGGGGGGEREKIENYHLTAEIGGRS